MYFNSFCSCNKTFSFHFINTICHLLIKYLLLVLKFTPDTPARSLRSRGRSPLFENSQTFLERKSTKNDRARLPRAEDPMSSFRFAPLLTIRYAQAPLRPLVSWVVSSARRSWCGGVSHHLTPLGLALQDYRLARSKTSFCTSVFDLAKEVLQEKGVALHT